MAQLSRFLGLVACMFYLEHGVPHVHIYFGRPSRSKKCVLVIRISDGEVVAAGNKFPYNRVYLAVAWSKLHRPELLKAWRDCREGKMPQKILPLSKAEGSPSRLRRAVRPLPGSSWRGEWPCIKKLEKLGSGRLRVHLDDGRIFQKDGVANASSMRIVNGGLAVKRNRADTIYAGAHWLLEGAKYIGRK